MPPPSRPAGVPLSRVLLIGPGIANDDLRAAVDAINRVHGDGDLPPIPVRLTSVVVGGVGVPDGRVWFRQEPEGGLSSIMITVRSDAPNRQFVLVHEIGHALDLCGLPGEGFASSSAAVADLDEWRRSVTASRAYAALVERGRQDVGGEATRASILRHLEELWARSYAQFMAIRSGSPALMASLERLRRRPASAVYHPLQWDDDEFVFIDQAIEGLFGRLGWLRSASPKRSKGRSRAW